MAQPGNRYWDYIIIETKAFRFEDDLIPVAGQSIQKAYIIDVDLELSGLAWQAGRNGADL